MLPALVTRGGTVGTLDLPPCPPLGLGGLPFEATEVDLPEGSLLALYTNGLIEAGDHDVETGLTLLSQALDQPSSSLEAACDTVLETLLPARPDDDVALLLARTHALGDLQVASWDLESDPAAVAGARSSASRQLSTWGLDDLDFTTELVVSELVTNAIRYGRPPSACASSTTAPSSARSPTPAAPPRTSAVPVPTTRAVAACSWSPSSPNGGAHATPGATRRSGRS